MLVRHEGDGDGRLHLDCLPRRSEPSGLGIDAEDNDAVGILVRGDEVRSRRIDGESARSLAPGRYVLEEPQSAFGFVDGEDGDGVVSTIRGIEEPAAGMGQNLRTAEVGRDGYTVRKRRHGLSRRENPSPRVVAHGGDPHRELVQDVSEAPGGMERDVPRPVAWLERDEGRIVVGEGASSGIEAVNEYPIEAEIRDDGEAIRGIDVDGMSAGGTRDLVLDEGGRGTEGAVRTHGEDRDTSAVVVLDEQMSAPAIQGQIAGAGTSRGRPVQQAKPSGRTLDRECARGSGGFPLELVDLIHRVEKTSRRMNCEK